ncbi:divergent protein kinase domain 1C [Oratosquilla oratoria]|uniref:divergent protein kinase domain 1C n=1 Tax=Oratosquilla oratoria TaxID=337810 RepID=UPI003F7665C3
MNLSFYFPCCLTRFFANWNRNWSNRLRCRMWVYLTGGVVALLAIAAVRDVLLSSSLLCSDQETIDTHVKKVCSEAKLVSDVPSLLCNELCKKSVEERVHCHTFHLNKPTVFTLDLASSPFQKVVVKSVVDEHKEDEIYWNTDDNTFPTKEDFKAMVSSYIESFLSVQNGEPYMEKVLNTSVVYHRDEESTAIHKNFWTLLYDSEFLFTVLFQEYKVFPRLYDTCANYYGVEFAKPLTGNAMLPLSMSWEERLYKALDILHYVNKLEMIWPEPIHLCDVKHDHFGWTSDGNVVFLDLDAVLTEESLRKSIESTGSCSEDEDCSFFDCWGRCSQKTARCLQGRSNTNLQVVCDKVFLGNTDGIINLYGLLVDPEASEDLVDALELCKTNRGMTVDAMVDIIQSELGINSN